MQERKTGPRSIKGEENNILTAEIGVFLCCVHVKGKWISVCHPTVGLSLDELLTVITKQYIFISTPDHGKDEITEHKFSTSHVDPVGLSAPPVIFISSTSGKCVL